MKKLGSVYVKGRVPKITYKGALTKNLEHDYDAEENIIDHEKTYVYFFGIPYAKPPLKWKRFKQPEPYKGGVIGRYLYYDATKEKPNYCIEESRRSSTTFGRSADCLYLNIYLPEKPKYIPIPLPVLVYFHGDGFYSGSGNYTHRTPDSIIKENIIFVTVNYRLGPFGFLNMHAQLCKGNAGLKDQVMALQWVRDNIEAFKGDPGNVTICGESAGGTCVNFHMISPLSKGLFHKAIVQSGGIYHPWGLKGHQREIMRHFKKYKNSENASYAKILKELELLGPNILSKLYWKIQKNEFIDIREFGVNLGPSFENFPEEAFIPLVETIEELMAQAEPVPTLAGVTTMEGYLVYDIPFPRCSDVGDTSMKNKDDLIDFLCVNGLEKSVATENYEQIEKSYFPNLNNVKNRQIQEGIIKLCTDLWFHRFYDNFKFGECTTTPAPPLYVYQFNCLSEINQPRSCHEKLRGAGHGDCIYYLFPPKFVRRNHSYFSPDATKKIRTMCSLWASFCKRGKPTCPLYKNIEWTPHTNENPCYLQIDNEIRLKKERLGGYRWNFMKSVFEKSISTKTIPKTPSFDQSEIEYLPIF